MVFRVVSLMLLIFVIALAVCNWSPHTAYSMLQHSQNFSEPDDQALELPTEPRASIIAPKRPYITPLVKKRVAARQKWRCASCRHLLDETYELDHIKPLFRGGANDESNLHCLCRRCHMLKSAVEQSSR